MKKIFSLLIFGFAVYGVYHFVEKNPKLEKRYKNASKFIKKKIKHQIKKGLDLTFTEDTFFFKEEAPKWMDLQIEQELSHYSCISEKSIANTLERVKEAPLQGPSELQLVKFKIKNNKLYFEDFSCDHPRLLPISRAIQKLLSFKALRDMEFLVTFHDQLDISVNEAPIFTFSKRKGNNHVVLIPDFEALIGYEKVDQQVDISSENFPWDKKIKKAYWRGGTTGGLYQSKNWKEFPRSKLVFASQKYKEILDAKFSSLVLGAEKNPEIYNNSSILSSFVSPAESVKYKYLIDIDGNASSYSRSHWILNSNCLPLKQESNHIQWFYTALSPYVHYVPFKHDLSDLIEKISWAKQNDSRAQVIAENGRNFAKKYLTTEMTYLYLYKLLKKYGEVYSSESDREKEIQ